MHLGQNHYFQLHKALHDKMGKIYIYQALLTFAKSMIGIFVPVYLYKIGYSLVEVILYSIGISLTFLIMIPVMTKVISRIGFKYSLLLSTPIYLLHILILNFLTESIIYFHLAWLTFGFYVAIFWPTFHSEIAINGSTKHRSSQMGTLQIITTIFGTFAPIIGGFFLEYLTYLYLFSAISVIILVGTIPLLAAKDIRFKNYEFNYRDYFRLIGDRKKKDAKRAFIYEGLDSLLILKLWPILVFILLSENFFSLGFLVTVVAFINLLFILYTKAYFDRNRHYFLKKIVAIKSLGWFLKSIAIFFGLFFLYIIESISKLSQNIFSMIFMSIFYNNAKKGSFMDYIILRELYMHSSKIMFSIAVIALLILFGESLLIISSVLFLGVFISYGLGYLKEEI